MPGNLNVTRFQWFLWNIILLSICLLGLFPETELAWIWIPIFILDAMGFSLLPYSNFLYRNWYPNNPVTEIRLFSWGWKNSSVVKSICCSCRRHEFSSPHSCWAVHNSMKLQLQPYLTSTWTYALMCTYPYTHTHNYKHKIIRAKCL